MRGIAPDDERAFIVRMRAIVDELLDHVNELANEHDMTVGEVVSASVSVAASTAVTGNVVEHEFMALVRAIFRGTVAAQELERMVENGGAGDA